MSEYANFRQRLDAALRTLDVNRVREFLLAEGQWDRDVPANPELAMWLMIAGSPTLTDLHPKARVWLMEHGHEEEAQLIPNRQKGTQGGAKQGQRPRPGSGKPSQGKFQNSPSQSRKPGAPPSGPRKSDGKK